MRFKRLVIATLLFAVIFLTIHISHVYFFTVDVVFYSAIFDAFCAVIVTTGILWQCSYFALFSPFEKMQIVIIHLLLGYSFAISVPTVIDRSLSFYILEKIEQRGGGIQLSGFEKLFTDEYMAEHRLIDVRLTEQLSSGTIDIVGKCVKITEKGRSITQFSRFYRKNFLPKKRLLMGEYSDDLTDPFANGAHDDEKSVDYLCQ